MKRSIFTGYLFLAIIAAVISIHTISARGCVAKRESIPQKAFSWWPEKTYQAAKDGISVTIRPFSEEETRALFGGAGKNLLTCTHWFIACPIVPMHMTIDNQTDVPILLQNESIDLGSKLFGIRREPVSLQHVLDALNKQWFSPLMVTDSCVYSGTTLIGTIERFSTNPDLYRSFLTIEKEYPIASLPNLQKELVFRGKLSWSSVTVDKGQKKEVLFFVWGKDIKKSGFNLTLGYNKFTVDFKK